MAFTPPALDSEEAGGFTPPALDSESFTPPPLEAEPAPGGAQWRPTEPKSLLSRAGTAVREAFSPLLGPTEAQRSRELVEWNGQLAYKPLGGKVEQEGFFPALSHPMVELPRIPEHYAPNIYIPGVGNPMDVAAAINTGLGFVEFAESPLGLATGGIGKLGISAGSPLTPRVIAGGYAADLGLKVPEAATQAGEISVTGTPMEQLEAQLGLATQVGLPGVLGKHALTKARLTPAQEQAWQQAVESRQPKTFSEFGGERQPAGPLEVKEVATVPAETKPPTEGAPPAQATSSTLPELPATLSEQVYKLWNGKAPAVLFGPKDAVPEWALRDERFQLTETPEGKVLYDTAAWTADEIQQRVASDRLGEVLDYGVPTKPANPTGAVTVRNQNGLELRAVVVDDATAPAVLEKAQRYADPGDVVALEPLDQVLSKRLSGEGLPRVIEADAAAAEYLRGKQAREAEAAAAAEQRRKGAEEKGGDPPSTRNPQPSTALVTERHLAEAREIVAQQKGEERATDIIDELEARGPVQFPADLADVIDASRERVARELHNKPWKRISSAQRKAIDKELRATTGEGTPWDQALQRDNEKYQGLSMDDLANAILDAAEGRLLEKRKGDSAEVKALAREIAEAESSAGRATKEAPATTEVDPWQSTIDSLNSLKLDTNGQLHAFGLVPVAWNAIIDGAVLAVRTGRKLGEAIDYAIEQIKVRFPGQLTDEAGARAALLVEVPRRATGQKITASPLVSDETKLAIQQYIYDPRSNRTDQQTALGIVLEHGPDAAVQLWRQNPNWMPGAVRSKLLGALTQQLATAERQARATGDTTQAAALVEQQRALWDEALPQITNTAQELQALNGLVQMSPDAQVARAREQVKRAGDAEVERHAGETSVMRQALDTGRAEGLEAVRTDAEVNTAARSAVDEAVKNSGEVHQAVVMELAGPWSQSPEILSHAREAVRAKANELLNSQPRPPQFTPAQHLRQILDDLAKRSAEIFASHIQGAEPGVPLLEKLQDRLGIDKEHATKLASSLSREWDKQLDKAKKSLDERLARARVRQEQREREAESASAVDRALRRQLRAMNLKLGEAIRHAAADRAQTGKTIADKIVDESGLTGDKADALRTRLQERWNTVVGESQQRALDAISKRAGVKISRKMQTAFDKLKELDRLAPVEGDAFFKAVRAALKLPELTEAQAKQLRELVIEAQGKPEGWQQQRVMAKALTLVEQAKGELAWRDVPFAIWYANIFSAPPTHLANLAGNSLKALEVLGIHALTSPRNAWQMLQSYGRGFETGGLEALNIAKTGSVEGTRLLKAEPARPLEAQIQRGGIRKALLPWAAVARAMAAEDMLFFKPLEEVKWQSLARRVAKQEGLRGELLDARVQDLLHNTRAKYDAAKVQAASEGLTGLDFYRRAHEIIEQQRETSMPGSTEQARLFALEHTFNAEPYGVMGAVAEVLNTMNRKLVVTRFAMPVVRIVANLANESLNYFPPVGLARVTVPRFRSDIVKRAGGDAAALEFATARAIVGTALFGTLAAVVANSVDDPDAPVQITGVGPRTKNQREQLRETGWKPNAIKLGDRWYSYQESQLAIPLAIMGNYSDALKYKGLDEKDALNRVAYTTQMLLNTILEQRMLSGVSDLVATLQPEGDGKELGNLLARSGSSFVVPNAVRWMDQVFDPNVYTPDDVAGALYAQTPFVRRQNRPALNALGDEVTRPPLDRFTSPAKPDALVTTLASKAAWVPMPNLDAQTVGNPRLGDAYQRPMTPDEYYAWIAQSGPEIRRRLTENLDRLAALPPDEAQAFVRRIAEEVRAKTKPK